MCRLQSRERADRLGVASWGCRCVGKATVHTWPVDVSTGWRDNPGLLSRGVGWVAKGLRDQDEGVVAAVQALCVGLKQLKFVLTSWSGRPVRGSQGQSSGACPGHVDAVYPVLRGHPLCVPTSCPPLL